MPDPITGDNGHAADGTNGNTQTVPISVVEGLREEMKGLKDTVSLQSDQIALYKANQPVKQGSGGGNDTADKGGGSAFEGLDNDSVITVSDLKKVMAGQDAKIQGLVSLVDVKVEHPDFTQTVNKYIPILIKERPDLAVAVRHSSNPGLLAYEICKTLPQYQKDLSEGKLKALIDASVGKKEDELSPEAKQLLESAAKIKSPSTGGGGGGGSNTAQMYANMSEADLEARIEAVKNKA